MTRADYIVILALVVIGVGIGYAFATAPDNQLVCKIDGRVSYQSSPGRVGDVPRRGNAWLTPDGWYSMRGGETCKSEIVRSQP